MKRACGILLPVASLPSEYGIGAFSKEAYAFVDQLAAAGDKVGADDLQQVNHVDAASDCGDDGGDKDDGDRFEFNGEAYNYDKHAK